MSDDVLSEDDKAALKPLYERLAALKSRPGRVGHWAPNKRYVIDFEIANAEIPETTLFRYDLNTNFAFRETQTNIDRNVIFLCEEIEVVCSIVGVSVATGTPATFVVSAPWRSQFVDFYLKFRDTGSDREWQNDWIPGNFFQSANLGGLILGDEGHALVSGGSAVVVGLQVARNDDTIVDLTSGLEAIETVQFKVSLIGCQIPLEGA
jgi:hypothetical protein